MRCVAGAGVLERGRMMAAPPRQILMVCISFSPNVGGVEAHLDKLTAQILRRGHRVTVLTYQPITTALRAPAREPRDGLEIRRVSWFGRTLFHRLEPYPALEFLYLFPRLWLSYLALILRQRFDVVHAHGFIASMIARCAPRRGMRRVASTHAIYHLTERAGMARVVRWMFRPFDRVLCVGQPSLDELAAIGVAREKLAVHPNWIDLDEFCPGDRAALKRELGLDAEGALYLLHTGRLIGKKGLPIILEAMRKLPAPVRLLVTGDGPEAGRVRLAESEMPGRVKFYGRVPREPLMKLYRAADVYVALPTYDEGFAGVYLESVASGTPAVTSNKGCLPTFLSEEVALLIEPTVENAVAAIASLANDAGRLRALQANCRPYAERHFSERNVEVILRSYEP